MSNCEWNDRYSIGIVHIDEHHRHLFSLLNRLYNDFVNKIRGDTLTALFDELVDYATYHFSAEEYWMQESFFPHFEKHKEEHALFSRRVTEMHKDYHAGRRQISLELLTFLNDWLAAHILRSDAEFGRFITAGNFRI